MSAPAPAMAAAAPPARLPCLPAQRRVWLLDRMNPGDPALNVAARWRLEGRAPGAELGEAVARLIQRNPALRTCIAEDDGAPVRVIAPAAPLKVFQVDLAGHGPAEALAEAGRLAALEAVTPFELSRAPLIRVTLLRLGPDLSIVLLTSHRLVADVAAVNAWMRELAETCAALQQGRVPRQPARLAPAAPPAAEGALRRDENFWQQALQGLPPFELLPDRPRPPVRTSHGARVARTLPGELVESLRSVARDHDCTLPMATLAALFVLLQRWSGETDIALGLELAGDSPGAAPADTGVIRSDLSEDPSFAQVLIQVRRSLGEALAHSTTSLERLIEIVSPARDLSRSALFSVHFRFQERAAADGDYGSFTLAGLPACPTGALYELNFSLSGQPDGWQVACEYNSDLFEAATAAQLLEHFINLLNAAAADPALQISRLPLLGAEERRGLLAAGNATEAPYPQAQTVAALFEVQAQRTPEAVALCCGARSLSYRELDAAANRLAHALRSRGAGRGSLVAIGLPRSSELVVALLAVLKAGAAYVPLDPGYPPARLLQIVDDARPLLLLTTRAVRAQLPDSVAEVIVLDAEADAAAIARQPESPPESPALPGDLAYVIYTSGSTGRPKGVQVRHRGVVNLLESMRREPGIVAGDTLLAVTTVAFDIAALELFLPLVSGARVVISQDGEAADGHALMDLLERHAVTLLQATPVTWQLLLAAGWCGHPHLKMLCGGEALPRPLAETLLRGGGELWNLYGPTETTIWSSALKVESGAGPVPIGGPIANTQFHVLDAHFQLLPFGAPGELFIGGDGVAPGYLNLAALTRDRFVPDPFRVAAGEAGATMYRTGDRVRRRPGGTLEFLGRNDGQVKVRGFRIELGEIETVLRTHAGVAECVAVAAPDAAGQTAIHAHVVARAGEAPEALAASLRTSLRQALPAHMCPAAIVMLPALPRTPNGKIDRRALAVPVPPPEPSREPPAAARPGTALEQRLAEIWGSVLGAAPIGLDANFFEVGGHSLLAVRLLARIESAFGRKLSLASLFGNPTIAGQAALLTHHDARAFDFRQVVKLQAQGGRPPLIAINNTGIYYALSRHLGGEQPFTSLQLFDPALPRARLPRNLPEIAEGYAQLIRRVQPAGPYALLGWCVAGTLAFEVARQLRAAGQQVSRLFLFDTLAPGHLQRLPWLQSALAGYAYRWKLIVADWHRAGRGPRGLAEFLANRTTVRKILKRFSAPALLPRTPAGANAGAPPLAPGEYDQWLLRYLEETAASYQPGPYGGPMTLFRSSQEPAGRFLDPLMGWGAFATGGIELAVIDGDHFSIFQEPRVSQLAQRIESALDRP